MVVSLLYMSLFFTLGMMISTHVRHAATSVVISLLVWSLVTLVLPGLAVELGKVSSPAATKTTVNMEKESVARETRLAARKVNRDKGKSKEEKNAQTADLRANEKQQVEALEAGYWRGVIFQFRAIKILARFLPSGCLAHALTSISGTDEQYVSNFQAAHRQVKLAYLKSIRNPQPEGSGLHVTVSPTVEVSYRDLTERLARAAVDIGLLAGYLLALWIATYLGFLRYDIR